MLGGEGVGEAGSRRCARAPSAPVPGLQGAQRARPGPRPPDTLPDTTLPGAWRTAHLGHCTGHCPPQGWTLQRTLLPSSGHCPPPSPGRFPPPPPGAQTPSPPQALQSDLLHPSARHCLLLVPLSLPLLPLHHSPAGVGAPPVSPTPCSSARLPAPPSPGCSPGCLSPGDCGGSSAAVEVLLFCTGTTGTASLAGTGTRTRTRRPLSCGPRVQRAAGG